MKCGPGQVHIWRIELDCAVNTVAALSATLSPDEEQRAARFRSNELRERWAVARGALRCILATYAGCEPCAVVFREGPQGKPAVASPGDGIPFNLSHTGGLALVAIAGRGRVGIDAEIVRPEVEVENLSRRFFASAEAAEILALPPERDWRRSLLAGPAKRPSLRRREAVCQCPSTGSR